MDGALAGARLLHIQLNLYFETFLGATLSATTKKRVQISLSLLAHKGTLGWKTPNKFQLSLVHHASFGNKL